MANKDWNSLFILDTVGAGFLKFNRAHSSKAYTCALKLDDITDAQRGIAPEIRVEFRLGPCDPEMGDLQTEILKGQTLIVDLSDKKKPQGRVQWLVHSQPDDCTVEKLSLFDIQLDAKRWHDGNWARSTASEGQATNSSHKK